MAWKFNPFTNKLDYYSSLEDYATKAYVDMAIGFQFDYFFNNTSAGIEGKDYFNMTDTDLGGDESYIETTIGSSGDDKPLGAMFISLSGEPGVHQLESGIYDLHFHAERMGGSSSTVNGIYAKLYRYEADENEIEIGKSEVSGGVTSKATFEIHLEINSTVEMATTDRLLIKFFANLSGGSGAIIRIYQEGATDSHLSFQVSSAILSSVFLRVDGGNVMTGNLDMNLNQLLNVKVEQVNSLPGSGNMSRVVYLTTDNHLYLDQS